ncbi:MAG: peptidoglycan-binding domain-containing protein [bacterium]
MKIFKGALLLLLFALFQTFLPAQERAQPPTQEGAQPLKEEPRKREERPSILNIDIDDILKRGEEMRIGDQGPLAAWVNFSLEKLYPLEYPKSQDFFTYTKESADLVAKIQNIYNDYALKNYNKILITDKPGRVGKNTYYLLYRLGSKDFTRIYNVIKRQSEGGKFEFPTPAPSISEMELAKNPPPPPKSRLESTPPPPTPVPKDLVISKGMMDVNVDGYEFIEGDDRGGVTEIQRIVKILYAGYLAGTRDAGIIDNIDEEWGYFGNFTEELVTRFQNDYMIPQKVEEPAGIGKVGLTTWYMMEKVLWKLSR